MSDRRYCRACKRETAWVPGKAIRPTVVSGAPDFPGDNEGQTLTFGGPGKLVFVVKCAECGRSVTV